MQVNVRELLETTCPTCKGSGWVVGRWDKTEPAENPRVPNSRRCDCVGGKVPTELGEAVLEFVKDHLYEWARERGREHTHGRGE